MHATAKTIRKTTTTKKSPKRPARKRSSAPLTNEELLKYAKKHPAPASFWDGDDDPSKPTG